MQKNNKKIRTDKLSRYGINYLHAREIWVIKRWREKYKFGEITLSMNDGVPQRIKKAIFYDSPRQ